MENKRPGRIISTLEKTTRKSKIMEEKVDIIEKIDKYLDEGVQKRPLYQIAAEIKKDWKKVHFAAQPYLEAMMELDKITDMYMADTAQNVVGYFLGNARTWKGETAKRIKAELKAML